MCFLIGPGRTDMCSLYIYTSHSLIENFTVRCLFSLKADIIRKQIITFFAPNNYYFFNVHKLCGTCSRSVRTAFTEKCAKDLRAAVRKYRLGVCKMKKSKIPKGIFGCRR